MSSSPSRTSNLHIAAAEQIHFVPCRRAAVGWDDNEGEDDIYSKKKKNDENDDVDYNYSMDMENHNFISSSPLFVNHSHITDRLSLCRILTVFFGFGVIVGMVVMLILNDHPTMNAFSLNQSVNTSRTTSNSDTPTTFLNRVQDQELSTVASSNNTIPNQPNDNNNNNKNICEPTTLVLIRHCEKLGQTKDPDGNEHCSYIGYQRAEYLATLFGNNTTQQEERYPLPNQLYAYTSQRNQHENFREYETLVPLSKKINIPIEFITQTDLIAMILAQIQSQSLCGQILVICWKHSYIAELATAIGCTSNEGCPDEYKESDYDPIWIIQYIYRNSILLVSNSTATTTPNQLSKSGSTIQDNIKSNQASNSVNAEEDDDDDSPTRRIRRRLGGGASSSNKGKKTKKNGSATTSDHKKEKTESKKKEYDVYGTVSYQRFDPLEYMKTVGIPSRIGTTRERFLSTITSDEM